ncbi:uncharacterized protein LOC144424376 [Styela clava]
MDPNSYLVELHESLVREENNKNLLEHTVIDRLNFRRGITLAILREEGNMPRESEQLKNSVRHGAMRRTAGFSLPSVNHPVKTRTAGCQCWWEWLKRHLEQVFPDVVQ